MRPCEPCACTALSALALCCFLSGTSAAANEATTSNAKSEDTVAIAPGTSAAPQALSQSGGGAGSDPQYATPHETQNPSGTPNPEKKSKSKATEETGRAKDQVQEVVVTGTFIPVSKIEATTAVSTIDSAEMETLVPINALDLLLNVPGVYVDSSQGLISIGRPGNSSTILDNNQITSRGLGFVVVEEDGLPIEGALNIGANNLLRADSTLEQIQVVRGGSASITGANAPGGIFNYITKTGGDVLSSVMSVSYGLQGNGMLPYQRAEADFGGPLPSDGWYFNIGGYYQHDYGSVDAGYPLDFGGQLKANVLKKVTGGSVELYVKYLNDHNTFNQPIPAANFSSPAPAPGWSNTSSPLAPASSYQYPIGRGSYATADGGDLVRTVSKVVGLKFDLDLGGGWSINNNVKFTNSVVNDDTGSYYPALTPLNMPFNAIAPFNTYGTPGVYTFSDRGTGTSAQVQTDPTGTVFTVINNNLPGSAGIPNAVMSQSALISNYKDNEWLDQIIAAKKFDDMTFIVGAYYDHSNASLNWLALGGMSTFTPQPDMLDVTLRTTGGQTLQVTNPAGYSAPTFGQVYDGRWRQTAYFFGHNWKFAKRWSLDWGVRYEEVAVHNNNINSAQSVTTSNSNNVFANSYYQIGPLYHIDRSIHTFAYSGAFNYDFNTANSIYARYSLGKKSPDLGNFYNYLTPVQNPPASTPTIAKEVTQYELGYKLIRPGISLDMEAYYSLLTAANSDLLAFVQPNGAPGLVGVSTPASKTRDFGLEIDGRYDLGFGFAMRTALTWQKATALSNWVWTQPNGPGPESDVTSTAVLVNLNPGLKAELIPSYEATITPSYTKGPFTAQWQWEYMGARPANNLNAFDLPAYQISNITLQWRFSSTLSLSFTENNIFNKNSAVEWAPPISLGFFNVEAFTRANIQANPNAVFQILGIQARACFLKLTYIP